MSDVDDNEVRRKRGGRPRKFDRQVALRQAMDVFWLKGYDDCAISDLTTAMHINSPSLYASFGGKEGLYREALDLYTHLEGTATKAALEGPGTVREVIGAMLRRGVEAFTEGPVPRGCMVMMGGANIGSAHPDLRALIRDRQTLVLDAIRLRFERAKAGGELTSTTDIEALTTLSGLVLAGLAVQAREGACPAQLLAAIGTFVQTIPASDSSG